MPSQLVTCSGENVNVVEDFKYLGAWIKDSAQDIKIRKAQAWIACQKLTVIWKSI